MKMQALGFVTNVYAGFFSFDYHRYLSFNQELFLAETSVVTPAFLAYFVKRRSSGKSEECLNSLGLTTVAGVVGFGIGAGTRVCLDKLLS